MAKEFYLFFVHNIKLFGSDRNWEAPKTPWEDVERTLSSVCFFPHQALLPLIKPSCGSEIWPRIHTELPRNPTPLPHHKHTPQVGNLGGERWMWRRSKGTKEKGRTAWSLCGIIVHLLETWTEEPRPSQGLGQHQKWGRVSWLMSVGG